ncbi:hypothetical protein Ga0609869_000307 [Rhodovulum iodosum]|uniref:Uncharacterized protein n=1 Tax=Rhodovulum iodosum TaxID=68291 RepID=A0ABV3XP12_9RHOB|nr:hypothetical protein [Rhodovulum robiginosum]RSK34846.1 hypothetical protein EJA01_07810 [Rhodovulum robiginosum]
MKTLILAAALAATAAPALAHGGHAPAPETLHGLAHAMLLAAPITALGVLAVLGVAALRRRRPDPARPGTRRTP